MAAFGTAAALRGGAEVVAAIAAEAQAIAVARAEDGAEFERGEDGEEKGEEPVGAPDAAQGFRAYHEVSEAEAGN